MFPNVYKKFILIVISLALPTLLLLHCEQEANAKKIKQVHKIENPRRGNAVNDLLKKRAKRIYATNSDSVNHISKDTVTVSITDSISFSGYDKPAPSSKESFHIVNFSATQINKVGIRITYLDLKDRMLHSREVEVECSVPGGESRLTSIPSWDSQRTFFYYLGPEPKKVATPYKVVIKLLWVEL